MAEESIALEEKVESQPIIKIARWLQKTIGVIVPVLFMLLAHQIVRLYIYDYFTPWVSFGNPPTGAVSFVEADQPSDGLFIFVESQAEEIYTHSLDVNGNWILPNDEEIPIKYSHCEPMYAPFTKPPEKVANEISFRLCLPPGTLIHSLGWMPRQYRFAILYDGTVWGWISEPEFGQYIRSRFYSGLIAYMLSGISWFLFQNYYHTIQPSPTRKFAVRLLIRILILLLCYPMAFGFVGGFLGT